MRRLLGYLRPYRRLVAGALGALIGGSALQLAQPYLLKIAIDRYIGARDALGLGRIALWMLVAYLLDNAFQAASSWIMARVSQGALQQVRRDLFGHLQNLSIKFFDTHTAGELMSRLTNDIDAINQAVSQNVTSLVASVLSLAGIVIAMILLNHWLADLKK